MRPSACLVTPVTSQLTRSSLLGQQGRPLHAFSADKECSGDVGRSPFIA